MRSEDTGRWAAALFAAIDRKDADAFARHFAEDGRFVYGNAPPVQGREAVRESVAAFFGSIASLAHTLEHVWPVPGHVVAEGRVRYVRHDGREAAVPFANVMAIDAQDRVTDYRIYVDAAPLFAA